ESDLAPQVTVGIRDARNRARAVVPSAVHDGRDGSPGDTRYLQLHRVRPATSGSTAARRIGNVLVDRVADPQAGRYPTRRPGFEQNRRRDPGGTGSQGHGRI